MSRLSLVGGSRPNMTTRTDDTPASHRLIEGRDDLLQSSWAFSPAPASEFLVATAMRNLCCGRRDPAAEVTNVAGWSPPSPNTRPTYTKWSWYSLAPGPNGVSHTVRCRSSR